MIYRYIKWYIIATSSLNNAYITLSYCNNGTEGMGFEPMSPFSQAKRLAGARTRPLCDPSVWATCYQMPPYASILLRPGLLTLTIQDHSAHTCLDP